MNRMNANKLMALLGLEYPTTSRYKELHAAVTQALEVARVEGATDCCMAYDCERLKPQPAEPVQKLRPDFIAGYDAGMKDMMRRVKTEIAEQPLPEPQPEASELRICARRVLIAWDGTVLPKSRDSLMQERMEDLRVALDFEEPSPSKKLLAAGFTPRDRRLECDECGAKVTPQMMPLHECEQPEPVAWIDNLGRPQPHCVTDLKYCSVMQHELKEHLSYIPLYVSPPAPTTQEPVALTDGEIETLRARNIVRNKGALNSLAFARAVLAAQAGLGAQRGN